MYSHGSIYMGIFQDSVCDHGFCPFQGLFARLEHELNTSGKFFLLLF